MKQMKAFAIFILGTFVLFAAYASWAGFVLVKDRTGLVDGASIVGFQGGRSLIPLPGGSYFGIPPYDGAVEIVCSDGSRQTGGLVSRGASTYLYVTGNGTCEAIG